jgi:acyl-CoA synthetase (AMP-forming)/AMP-acid ligase II
MTAASDTYGPAYFRAQGWWRDETLKDWVQRAVDRAPDRPALITTTAAVTYAEMNARARQIANGLAALGIRKGDVAGVRLPNLPEFVLTWLAINSLGAVMQTLHMAYGKREVARLLQHSGARALIAASMPNDQLPAGELASLKESVSSLQHVIGLQEAEGVLPFASLARDASSASESPRADDPFLLLYTSGTTSAPKGVSVTYNHFLSNARLAAGEFGLTADDRILCLAPYTHLYGLYTLQLALAVGASACILPVFTPPGCVEAIRQTRPTVLFGAPGHIAGCMQMRLFDGLDLSSIRMAVLSGTTVPPELSAAFEHLLPNGRVAQAWGMTELQFGSCGRLSDPREARFNSVGRAMPGTELRVVDVETGRPLGGSTGELQVRGCSVFSGYAGNPEVTAKSFTPDGWFRTGDLAQMDERGYVRLRGRIKEIINRGGVKYHPGEVEALIEAHPAVAQAAVAAIPDATLGERAACFLVLKPGSSVTLEELTAYLKEQKLAKFMWPEHLMIVPEMPMTPTRKIIKSELIRRFDEEGRSRSAA